MLQRHKTKEGPGIFSDSPADQYLDITCKQSPVVRQAIQEYGDASLSDYLKGLTPDFKPPLQKRDDLEEVVYHYASPLLGKSAARTASQDLAECPFVMTANHHGVDFFSQSVQGSLFFSLHKNNGNGSGATVPIFSCGAVPLDNLTYPLGLLLYHVNGDALATVPKKLPVFSNRVRRSMVSVAGPLDEAMVQRAEARFNKMVEDKVVSPRLAAPLHELFQEDYCSPAVMNLSSYSQQSVVLNARIWRRLFSESDVAPQLVYLEIEKIVQMLLEFDLLNPKSLAWCVMFDPELRGEVLTELDGAKACWDLNKLVQRLRMGQVNSSKRKVMNGCGTLLFWGINADGRRIPLYLERCGQNREMLRGFDDRGTLWELPYTPRSILDALSENHLLPSLFTCFLVLSFARGVTCAGGYFQGEYLPIMQEGLVKALRSIAGYRNTANIVESVPAYAYLSGMQAVMIRIKKDALIPAGPAEIIAGGGLTDEDIQRILSLTVRDAHLASLLETVPDVAPWVIETPDWKDRLAADCCRLLGDKVVIK